MAENIIITDGYTLNPGDLSWSSFETLGPIVYYDRTREDQVADRCRNATVIITNKTPVNAAVIEQAERLKMIAVTATGYNVIDTRAARKKNVLVCNVPGYGTDSVAQHTFALILELTNHVGKNSQRVFGGEWSHSEDWCFTKKPLIELHDKILGIIGYGRIGQKVAFIAKSFGMQVIYFSPSLRGNNVHCASIEEIFSTSDFVSLHCPLTDDNAGFVNTKLLSLMKSSAYLINTSRGQLIHETDLANALTQRRLAGAALDVLSKEPPPEDHPLIGLSNCIITPHNAWLSKEARQRIMETTYNNVVKALAGEPQNVVNN